MKKVLLHLLFFIFFVNFPAQENLKIKFYKERVNNTVHIYVDNNELFPVSVRFQYQATNMNSLLPNGKITVIPPNTTRKLFNTFSSLNPYLATKFNYDVEMVNGDVFAKHSNYIYELPFVQNKKVKISQGYFGNFSHSGIMAIDFNLKEGEKVLAARGGKVVEIVEKNNQSCLSKNCAQYNNKIVILHDDSTFGEYVHLKKDGVLVELGTSVETGDPIAISGNTGWSNGPHLHFSVYSHTMDTQRTYHSTKFRVNEFQEPIILKEKEWYSH